MQAKDKLRPTWRPSAGSPQQKCTPIPAYGGTSPGGGSLLSAFLSANLCRSFYSAAKTSPSGGGAVGRRGAFPAPVRAVGLFSPARQGGCTVLYILAPLLFQGRPPRPFPLSEAMQPFYTTLGTEGRKAGWMPYAPLRRRRRPLREYRKAPQTPPIPIPVSILPPTASSLPAEPASQIPPLPLLRGFL